MKKIYMILSAVALTVSLSAQQLAHMEKPALKQQAIPSAVYTQPVSEVGYEMNAVPFRTTIPEVDTTLLAQYWIEGQMYRSFQPGYISMPMMMNAYADTLEYYSLYGKGTWEYDGEDEEGESTTITVKDTGVLAYPAPSFGWSYYNPTLSVPARKINVGDTIIYNTTFTDYMYGYAAESYWPGEIAPTYNMIGYWQPEMMTNCEMVTGDRSGDKDKAGNRYMVSSYYGDYCFGTGLEIDKWGKGTLDTLCNIIPIPEGASMWVDTVFVHCYSNATDITNIFPATTNLKLAIYPITVVEDPKTGKITQYLRHDSIMAQATAVQEDCVADGGGYSIQFVFKEKNPFGILDVKPATLGQRCYAELTGFNDSKCDFGIYCDYWPTPTGGRTLWKKNGKFRSYGDMNIDMAFNGYFTNMHQFDDTRIKEVGEEGGVVQMEFMDTKGKWQATDTLLFACNISTDFEDDADLAYDGEVEDWIADYEIVSGPYTYEEGGSEYISLTCQAIIELEANEDYDREFTVYLVAYGAKMPIQIYQKGALGPKPVGLPVVKAVNDNKLYNIMGVEVDENYKGVVIYNGQKRLQ